MVIDVEMAEEDQFLAEKTFLFFTHVKDDALLVVLRDCGDVGWYPSANELLFDAVIRVDSAHLDARSGDPHSWPPPLIKKMKIAQSCWISSPKTVPEF